MESQPPRHAAGIIRRRVGRVTIVERPDALIVTSPFLPRTPAAFLGAATALAFAVLEMLAFGGAAPQRSDVIGMTVVFGVCGYVALILGLNGTTTTVRADRIVVRRGPVPMWPATTIDPVRIEDVHALVVKGFAGWGARTAMDPIVASLAGGRCSTLIDDAGSAGDARHVAATITTWLWSRRA